MVAVPLISEGSLLVQVKVKNQGRTGHARFIWKTAVATEEVVLAAASLMLNVYHYCQQW